MKTKQTVVKFKDINSDNLSAIAAIKPQLGFVFGSAAVFENDKFMKELVKPGTQWVGCSTAGEVSQKGVTDDTVVLTGIHFENPKTRFKVATSKIESADK